MLPLSGESLPSTSAELVAAIERGLAELKLTARSVRADGGAFPAIGSLTLDLTDARATRELRAPALKLVEGHGGVTVGAFQLRANPLHFEGTPFEILLNATDAAFVFAGAPEAGALMLKNAKDGDISLAAATKDLEALLHELVVQGAGKQGVNVKKTTLELTAQGPRRLLFRVEVTAKMFLMTAAMAVSGQLDVDDELNARFSNLTLGGDGMITKMAGGFIRPKLEQLEKRTIPLLAFSLGDLRLRDVEVATGDKLTIRGSFGSGAR